MCAIDRYSYYSKRKREREAMSNANDDNVFRVPLLPLRSDSNSVERMAHTQMLRENYCRPEIFFMLTLREVHFIPIRRVMH